MTNDEYNLLFHNTQSNMSAFKRLMDCDAEVIKMIEAAVESENTQAQELYGKTEQLEAEIKRLQEREWVSLTDEELNEHARWADEHGGTFYIAYARSIESKLKEKNA